MSLMERKASESSSEAVRVFGYPVSFRIGPKAIVTLVNIHVYVS